MSFIKKYIGDLYLETRFFYGLSLCIALLVIVSFIPMAKFLALAVLFVFLLLVAAEYIMLFFAKNLPVAVREVAPRLSLGTSNSIHIRVKNPLSFTVYISLIDEQPVQLQNRHYKRKFLLPRRRQVTFTDSIKPLLRGEYDFGDIQQYVSTRLRFISRRITSPAAVTCAVFPAFSRLHRHQLVTQIHIPGEAGNARLRKIGSSTEFEQVKEYITGDDIRKLNWKASARAGSLMVNQYREERAQQVYICIDKGRLMKMPFNGLSLLDHAINSALMLSNVCLAKQDRVGLLTFSHRVDSVLAADPKPAQIERILQTLYRQQTDFLETDFEKLYSAVRAKIRHRSLLVIYSNFESLSGLQRQSDYLRLLARYHLVVLVFFENTALKKITGAPARGVEDIYIKTIAEKFAFEKRLIARELERYGVTTILSAPENLTVNTINKYLELKARQAV